MRRWQPSTSSLCPGSLAEDAQSLSKNEVKGYREFCILLWAFGSAFVLQLDIIVIVGIAGILGIIVYRDDPVEEKAD